VKVRPEDRGLIMKKKGKLILGALILLGIVGFLVFGNKQALQADLLTVQPSTIAQTFTEDGYVVPEKEIPLYTSTGGKVTVLAVQDGEKVQHGDLLLSFDATELHLQLRQLEGQLKSLQAQHELEQSKLELDKLKQLYEAGAISKKEYEDAQNAANYSTFPGQIEAIQAQIAAVQHKLKESNVYAPASGTITRVEVKEGMFLAPGSPLMTLHENDNYLVEAYVLTEDVVNIQPKMQVELIQDNPDGDLVFPGTITKINPAAEEKVSALGLLEQRIKVTIKPDIPEKVQLKPGYVLDVDFTLSKKENVLAVPKTALFPFEGGEALWVVRNNVAQIQPVKTGFENQQEIVITEGLKAGDTVILDPQLEGLKEGARISN
jgi:HlyD family secretion protein